MRSGLYVRQALALVMLGATAAANALPLDRAKPAGPAGASVWQAALEAFRNGDCPTAMRLIVPRLKDPVPQVDTDRILSAGAEMATTCALRGNDKGLAYRYALEGTARNLGSDLLWRMRLALELQKPMDSAVVTTVEAMAQGHIAALNETGFDWLTQFYRKLKREHQDDLRRRLLSALLEKGYSPTEPLASLDPLRQDYAAMLYAAGDKAGAETQVGRIDEPRIAIELSFDPRFRSMLGPDFDPRASVERKLVKARVAMEQRPDMIKPIVETAGQLLKLGRPSEALAVLETARVRIVGKTGFADAATQTNWWWNQLSQNYVMLGRFDDAVAAMRAGSDSGEQGGLNVSQTINLADLQNSFGKGELALETLKPFSTGERSVSPFGELALRKSRGCANAMAGHKDAIAEDLAFAQAHEADNRFAVRNLRVCAGDLDGAASSIIRQLDDPERQAAMLVNLSDYDAAPVKQPDTVESLNWGKVRARADVKAAIARAGGTRRIHLQSGEY